MNYLKLLNCIVLIGLAVSMVGCTGLQIHSDYDAQANLAGYVSFAWADDVDSLQSRNSGDRYISPLDLQRIENAIESELAVKGYRQIENLTAADFLVSFTVGAREIFNTSTYSATYQNRWYRHWPYYGEHFEVHSYTEGMLAIDIFDNESGRPVWHGVAEKRITQSDIESTGVLIQDAVAGILNEFPPETIR